MSAETQDTVGHRGTDPVCQGIAFPFVELRKSTEHLTHTSPERVELDKSRFCTLAL